MRLTLTLAGKTIDKVFKAKNQFEFRFTDGTSVRMGMRDKDGNLIEGDPDILFEGKHVMARGADIRRMPDGRLVQVNRPQSQPLGR